MLLVSLMRKKLAEGKEFRGEAFFLPGAKSRRGLGFTCRISVNQEMMTIMKICVEVKHPGSSRGSIYRKAICWNGQEEGEKPELRDGEEEPRIGSKGARR